MGRLDHIQSLVDIYDDDDFRPDDEAADAVTVGAAWMRDARAQLGIILARLCPDCEGCGWVENPHARYSRDRDTGQMETNDPEDIDCPHCDGVGFVRPPRYAPTPLIVAADDELPF